MYVETVVSHSTRDSTDPRMTRHTQNTAVRGAIIIFLVRRSIQNGDRMNMRKPTRPSSRKVDTAQMSGSAGISSERLSPNASSNTDGTAAIPGGEKRKAVTPEEAALTAKNYRLAKELVSFIVEYSK